MPILGSGAARRLKEGAYADIAKDIDVHLADLKAVAEVESHGEGWFVDGRLKILFEKHIFLNQLPPSKKAQALSDALGRTGWVPNNRGGYDDQRGVHARYALLERAIELDEDAAYCAISMGTFQIMGFNHEICGFASAKDMFEAFANSESAQLASFALFLEAKGLIPALRDRNFNWIEEVYNGGGQGGVYAERMRVASNKLRKDAEAAIDRTPAPSPPPAPVIEEPPQTGFFSWLRKFFSRTPRHDRLR